VELLQEFFLFQHVHAATREGNILDLVISNEISMVVDVKILEHFSTNDHNMVEFQLVLKTNVLDVLIYKHDFNRGNYNAIKSAFGDINWCAAFDGKCTLDCYKLLYKSEKEPTLLHCLRKEL